MLLDLKKIAVRQIKENDLPKLEWGGQFTHFRRIFANAFQNQQNGNAVLWIAEITDHYFQGIIGQTFVQLIGSRPELANGNSKAYIYSVRVKAAFRNMGIGTMLMEHSEWDIFMRGFSYATLNVGKHNIDARRFYERLGYKIVGDESGKWSYKDHLGKRNYVNEPSWRMQKHLRYNYAKQI
jgi:ribosomal protein S18 acetylase RimI-like enzyme